MTTSWILVANSSKARIYSAPKGKLINGGAKLNLISEHEHPDSRKKDFEITSDQLGRHRTKGGGHGDFVEQTDPQDYEFERFAKELARVISEGRVAKAYDELIVIAPQKFHGMLNKNFSDQVKSLIISNINHDYVNLDPEKLAEKLENFL